MMRTSRRSLLILLAGLALACAGAPDPRTEDADEALRRGQAEKALALYASARAERPDDPILRQKEESARRRVVDEHLDRARELAGEGSFDAAAAEVDAAARWAPSDPRIETAREEVEKRREAAVAGIRQAVLAADAAAKAGRPGAALALLREARARYGNAEDLVADELRIREGTAAALAARMKDELAAGRAALAVLLGRAAKDLTGHAPDGLAAAEAAFARDSRGTVVIGTFEDGTRGKVSPTAFEAKVAEDLAKLLPPDVWTVTRGDEGTLVLDGSISSVDVETIAPETKRQRVEYVVRIEQRENPARPRLDARIALLDRRLAQAKEIHEAAADELDALEEYRLSPDVHFRYGRRYGPYNEAAYYRYLGDARAREANAKNRVEELEHQLETAKAEREEEPVWLERPITATAELDVTTYRKTAVAAAEASYRGPGGEIPGAGGTKATATATDTAHAGRPDLGIPADPVDLPSDAALARRAVDGLAAKVAEATANAALGLRSDLLPAAEERLRAGDEAGALDRWAAFLLSAGAALEMERATAAEGIRNRLGIGVGPDGLDLENLRVPAK